MFKKVGERMSSSGMTLAKGMLSVVMLGAVVWIIGFQAMDSQAVWILIASGLIGIAAGDTFFFKALQDLSPVSMIVLMVMGQVLTILLALVFLQEMPSATEWAGIACIITGVAVALSADLGGEQKPSTKRGLAYGMLAVVCMAVSFTIAKGPLDRLPSLQSAFVRMAAGTAGIFAVGLMGRQIGGWMQPLRDGKFFLRFFIAVSVVTFGGFWLSLHAMKHLDLALANTLNSTEPIFVLPLAYFVLQEKIKPRSAAGALIAVAGVAIICLLSPT